MPKPPHKELRNIKNDLEKTLSMCVKAGEMATKTVDDVERGAKLASRIHFSSLTGYISYAKINYQFLLDHLTKIGV